MCQFMVIVLIVQVVLIQVHLCFANADVGSSGSTRYFSGGTVSNVDCVSTHQIPRGTDRATSTKQAW